MKIRVSPHYGQVPGVALYSQTTTGNSVSSNQQPQQPMTGASDRYVGVPAADLVEEDTPLWQKLLLGLGTVGAIATTLLYTHGRKVELKIYETMIRETNPNGIAETFQSAQKIEKELIGKTLEDGKTDHYNEYGKKGFLIRGNTVAISLLPEEVSHNLTALVVSQKGGRILSGSPDLVLVSSNGKLTNLGFVNQNGESVVPESLHTLPTVNVKADGSVHSFNKFPTPSGVKRRIALGWRSLTSGQAAQGDIQASHRQGIIERNLWLNQTLAKAQSERAAKRAKQKPATPVAA